MLKKAHGNDAMKKKKKKTAVNEWHKRFREGRTNIEDNPRSGRPSSSTADENVERVREIVRADRRITLDAIVSELEFHMRVSTAFFMMI
ncbi:hypothetical protein AVEN_126435-1 [Araneus ventricosus]|uniref:Uncharacterized protein n=1 Tax=Araneus ventricosus TaxID=182803 RepID=A0A4Y2DJW9_ARAVE|nr:hypothetical protein AVEN_126435-1 [Araneus ventricosus]